MGDDGEGRVVAQVRDFQGPHQRGQTLGAETERLPVDADLSWCVKFEFGGFAQGSSCIFGHSVWHDMERSLHGGAV